MGASMKSMERMSLWVLLPLVAGLTTACSKYQIQDTTSAGHSKSSSPMPAATDFTDVTDAEDVDALDTFDPNTPDVPKLPKTPTPKAPAPIVKNLDDALNSNEACKKMLAQAPTNSTYIPNFEFDGVGKDLRVGNAGTVRISGISKDIIIHKAETVDISGVHGSVCVNTKSMSQLQGINGVGRADLAITNAGDTLGTIGQIQGVSGSDIVISGFEVKLISGIKRNIYIFGGSVKEIMGVSDEIHLYDGAKVERITGIHGQVIEH